MFHFIVKRPAESLIRALGRGMVRELLNDFLDTLFNLGIDPQNELRETSPLIYSGHDLIRQDQIITEVKVTRSYSPLKVYPRVPNPCLIVPVNFVRSLHNCAGHSVKDILMLAVSCGKNPGATSASVGCRRWIHSYYKASRYRSYCKSQALRQDPLS